MGSLVRIRRRAVGLTQQELADLARVSVGTVRDLEQGRTHRPCRDSVARLAIVLGLDAARLQALARSMPQPAGHGGGRPRVASLQLKVLGPVEAWRGGGQIGLGESRQRAVLGLLALNPDVAVHRETLIDAVWGEDPPETAAQLVQAYVSRLRRTLDPEHSPRDTRGLLVSAGTSYRLQVGADQLDLLAFGQLADRARAAAAAGEPDAACDAYELALGLWRGEPVADVEMLGGHPAAVQMSRARAAAVLEYAELAGQAGRWERVLGHLGGLAAREPLNEKACAQLMLALAAAGQQAAALHAYEDLRRRLDEQLGVLPGTELAQVHLRVLRQEIPAPRAAAAAGRPGGGGPGVAPDVASGFVDGGSEPGQPPPSAAETAGTTVSADHSAHPPTDTWVAAVHAAEDDADPIGAGVAIDDNRVLTCAHVVVSAEGVVREPLWVSFPKADRWPRRRVAAVTVSYSPPVRDLAVLVLQEPAPADVDAAPLPWGVRAWPSIACPGSAKPFAPIPGGPGTPCVGPGPAGQ